ncbi:MAG TPA: DoxX family protein, partial [Chitinophagaceae bacterium]|nr:DoxX family protein [Chitinophagaceae bacterium]
VPGFDKIKEWAYAGLFFDLFGAIFSVVYVSKKFDPGMLFILLPVVLGALSYYFWNRKKSFQ